LLGGAGTEPAAGIEETGNAVRQKKKKSFSRKEERSNFKKTTNKKEKGGKGEGEKRIKGDTRKRPRAPSLRKGSQRLIEPADKNRGGDGNRKKKGKYQ